MLLTPRHGRAAHARPVAPHEWFITRRGASIWQVEAQLEKDLVLNWLQERADIEMTAATDASVDDVAEVLGEAPEELAKRLLEEEEAAKAGEVAAPPAPKPAAAAAAPPDVVTPEAEGVEPPKPTAPDGFEWGQTF